MPCVLEYDVDYPLKLSFSVLTEVIAPTVALNWFVMKYITILAGLMAITTAKEMPKDKARAAQLYDSGVMHQRIMERKAARLAEEEQLNILNTAAVDAPYYQELPFALCRNGTAKPFNPNPVPRPGDIQFRCKNVRTAALVIISFTG